MMAVPICCWRQLGCAAMFGVRCGVSAITSELGGQLSELIEGTDLGRVLALTDHVRDVPACQRGLC